MLNSAHTPMDDSRELFHSIMQHGSPLRMLINQTPGVLYVFERSPSGAYSMPYISDRSEDILGIRAEDMVSDFNIVWQYCYETHIPQVLESIEQSAASLKPWHMEMPYNHPRKGKRWIIGHSNPQALEDGTIRWFGVFIDSTERRAMFEQNLNLEKHLWHSQRMETVGKMAGGLAHDLNNILLAITGFTELAKRQCPQDGPVEAKLDRVLQACQRAKNLIDKLLLFSRRDNPVFQPLDLQALIMESVDLIRAGMPAGIRLETRLNAENIIIDADEGQLQQVLMNLSTNAYHAMRDKGGILTIHLEPRLLQVGKPGCPPDLPGGEYLVLGVEDTGCGMSAETIDRLFEPYFTTKEKREGTGLGLPIVDGIVKAHHGAVTVDSRPGAGSLFEVFLPLKASQEAGHDVKPAPAIAPQPFHTASKKNVLLVDDELDLIELQAEFLRDWGFRVDVCGDPMDALDRFRSNPTAYDVLVTDQTMPEMTGIQLADEVRLVRPDLPVVLISGYGRDITAESLKTHNINAFLKKPFGLSDLARAIDKQCG